MRLSTEGESSLPTHLEYNEDNRQGLLHPLTGSAKSPVAPLDEDACGLDSVRSVPGRESAELHNDFPPIQQDGGSEQGMHGVQKTGTMVDPEEMSNDDERGTTEVVIRRTRRRTNGRPRQRGSHYERRREQPRSCGSVQVTIGGK